MKNCGIYFIVNIVNNKVYVGSSLKLSVRKKQHFNDLRKNKHSNKHLQASFNKYGEENFVFIVIENNLTEENLYLKERYYINLKNSLVEGYNQSLPDNNGKILKFGEKTLKNKKDKAPNKEKILVLDSITGDLITTYESIAETARVNNIKPDIVRRICNQQRGCKTYKKQIFIREKEFDSNIDYTKKKVHSNK